MTLLAMVDLSSSAVRGVVPSTYVRLLFDYLTTRGLKPGEVLGEDSPPVDDRGLGRYPVARWRQLLDRAATCLDDPMLGLHLGQTITPAHFGMMGYVFLACTTLGAALQRLAQYQRLLYDVSPMQVRIDGDTVILEWGTESGRPGALVDETAISALIQLARDMSSRPYAPSEVCFVNPHPTSLKPYTDYFGGTVRFACDTTSVRFPLPFLQWPLRRPDPELLSVLEQQASTLLSELPNADDFEQGLRRCIARLAREGEPSLERVASELHVSPRTLHRRLEERHLTFRGLRDDTRRRLAEDYLRDQRLQLSEIAQLLGYSEQSAFSRAFHRWTGTTPLRARRLVTVIDKPILHDFGQVSRQ